MAKKFVQQVSILIGVLILILTILNHHLFSQYESIENFDNKKKKKNKQQTNTPKFNYGSDDDDDDYSTSYVNSDDDYKNKIYKSQITRNMIPKGQEDLYVLKSEIVPPVCPACPPCASKPDCPPCPPCKRCPKPAYGCKLVPDYNHKQLDSNVKPFLTDFSKFEDL